MSDFRSIQKQQTEKTYAKAQTEVMEDIIA